MVCDSGLVDSPLLEDAYGDDALRKDEYDRVDRLSEEPA